MGSAWGAAASCTRAVIRARRSAGGSDEAEGSNEVDAADWDNYLKLLREMRAAMDAAYPDEHKELTIAMGMGIGVTGEAPMSELADILDAINLMTYDYNGAWDTGLIGHNAPLYADDAYPGPPSHFVDWGVNAWLQNVPASKLVLGLPAYGRAWANPSHGQQLAK